MEKYRIPLLMTASVSTRNMKGACFSDAEREKMYLETILFYKQKLLEKKKDSYKIVFVENSGWDLQRFSIQVQEFVGLSIEFISLDPALFDISKGKGYNELLLINEAVKKSEFIREAKAFVKVTGRYPIYNIRYFIDVSSDLIRKNNVGLYIDIKDHKLYDFLRLHMCGHAADVRLFATTVLFYQENISDKYVQLNDYEGAMLEGVMYNLVKSLRNKYHIVCRFRREPYFGGIEGSNVKAVTFTKNQDSFIGKIKRLTGNFIRWFIPFFWF